MNYPSANAVCEPKRRSQLVEEQDRLSQEATALSEVVGSLISRLETVSRKEPTKVETKGDCRVTPSTEAAARISSVTEQLVKIKEQVIQQLHLLEV